MPRPSAEDYQKAVGDWVSGFDGDASALERLNQLYNRSFTREDLAAEVWRRVYSFRQRAFREPEQHIKPEEAQVVVAQDFGFSSWRALMQATAAHTPPPGPAYLISPGGNAIGPRRRMSDQDWDELIGVLKERRIHAVNANGMMTDRAMARIAECADVVELQLGGSRELSDAGLLQVARMPQLEALHLSEYPGGRLTDRGLAVLRHLPNLRRFDMAWQAGISDAGAANLINCKQLESVDLMGTPTGDGAIQSLQGHARLSSLATGKLTSDAGLAQLRNFPLLRTWAGREGARLLLDGPFTNVGLKSLAELEGVADLDLFWHVTGISSAAFAHLASMPNLQSLGCDGNLSDDDAMRHIVAIPQLRKLRAQESVASEAGFIALAESRTLEAFWGRECGNFGGRAFAAFSKMPSLRSLGVSLSKVDDVALGALVEFPALRDLTPIGFKDDAFRHIGLCQKLERLTCMYCRDTGDAATEHIRGLGLRYYYAGLTKISDRSLEILGAMDSLEEVELYECGHVTDAGIGFLARLPRLRTVHLQSLPGVTLEGTGVFGQGVRVHYSG